MTALKNKSQPAKATYKNFAKINGKHPLQKNVSDSFVLYKARYRKGGKVSFFNYNLAKEMGLITKDHSESMNQRLEKQILDTFSLVIINEYDIENKRKFPEEEVKENFYMATRYLQLQHKDNVGISSGDGRSMWNGQIANNGQVWDISSCGTGATRLSPATTIHNKFFKTGDPSISYGCGYAEHDEGVASALMSEIFYKNNIPTERVLAIIKFPGNLAITVRAYPNLLRPSHFFLHLKQNNKESLENLVNFYYQQQVKNKIWKNNAKTKNAKYDYFLSKVCESFAKVSALFEDEYIFCWMDWDGDNILMDGAIIDYGSIRQFGLYHHEYRFDDDDRFSTSIKEQKYKARYIVQTFIQAIDFILTGEKKPISNFKKHKLLKEFDKTFEREKNKNLLNKMGFNSKQIRYILENKKSLIQNFRKIFSYFEMAKSEEGMVEVADGINCNAIFCMRDILRELPQLLSYRKDILSPKEFIEIIRSSYASDSDLKLNPYRTKMIRDFQKQYLKIIEAVNKEFSMNKDQLFLEILMRSNIINKADRITGDSISHIVASIQAAKPSVYADEMYQITQDLSQYQSVLPNQEPKLTKLDTKNRILKIAKEVIRENREGL